MDDIFKDLEDEIERDDSEEVRKQEERAAKRRKQELEDLRYILSFETGRAVLWRFLSLTRMFNSPADDTNSIVRMTGMQDVGRHVLSEIFTADPNAYIMMYQEHQKRMETMKREEGMDDA